MDFLELGFVFLCLLSQWLDELKSVFVCFFVCLGVGWLGLGEEESRRPGRQQQQQAQQQAQQNLNSELALTKEQLYDLFQQILGVKKFEHQLLFNALQVKHFLLLFSWFCIDLIRLETKSGRILPLT